MLDRQHDPIARYGRPRQGRKLQRLGKRLFDGGSHIGQRDAARSLAHVNERLGGQFQAQFAAGSILQHGVHEFLLIDSEGCVCVMNNEMAGADML